MARGLVRTARLTGGGAALAIAVVLGFAAAVLLFLRLGHGVDVTDEAYYAALAYRFALGGRPLVDEWGATQASAWIVSPLVRGYLALAGGQSGLVMFLRTCWFAGALAVAATAWRAWRPVFGSPIALAAAVATAAIVPFAITTLSYSTIAVASLAAGIACGARALEDEDGRIWALTSGALFGLAVAAYPTMALVAVAAGAFLLLRRRRLLLRWMLGLLATGAAMAASLASFVSGLADAIAYNRAIAAYAGGVGKLATVALDAARFYAWQPAFWVALAVFGWCVVRRAPFPRGAGAILLVLSLLVLRGDPLYRGQYVASLFVPIAAGAWLLGRKGDNTPALSWAFTVAAAAAVTMAYTSSTGFLNFGVGALVAGAPAMGVLLAAPGSRADGPKRTMWPVLTAAVVCAGMLGALWTTSYRDGPPLRQTAAVTSGPYAGISTSPATALFVNGLASDVARAAGRGDLILAYDDFPLAYLVTAAAPAPPTLWLSRIDEANPQAVALVISSLEEAGHTPTVVVRNDRLRPAYYAESHALDAWVAQRYRVVLVGYGYRVFVRR